MHEPWKRFEAWLAGHWPDGLAGLNPSASDAQIADLERALGVTLPADFTACLRIHDGQDERAGGLFEGTEFLSCARILDEWQVWKELLDAGDFADAHSAPAAGIRADWWNPRWIPFTYDGSGNHLCLDLDPAAAGRAGQVITMWHDGAERELLAPDFGSWFAAYVRAVCAGAYVYADEYGGLVPREDVA